MKQFDVAYVRSQFPALRRTVQDLPVAYLDGPGGTQTPQRVLDAVQDYLVNHNANTHGFFATTEETDAILQQAHEAAADFLGCAWDEISFGANMTTLTLLLAQALRREMRPGDEVVITELDHEANRGPWLQLEEHGIVVRQVPVDTATCTLDWPAFERLVGDRTKVVAIGYASNAVGTVNDVARATALAHQVGALSVVDAVHYALHGPIDVRAIDCDFLLCSAYKFFGPHVGLMYARQDVSARLRPLKLVTVEDIPPANFETGTLNHEGMAGTVAAIDFIAGLGRRHEDGVSAVPEGAARLAGFVGRRRQIVAGMLAGEAYEQPLAEQLIAGLTAIAGVTVYGPPAGHARTSTVSFTLAGLTAAEVARALGAQGLFVWDGHFYALRLVERLGLLERGGLVRVGLAPYNTSAEIERVLDAVAALAKARR
ncbi:MAG: cysteine desulfurase-like protein [Thermoleophilia bacterium]